jgi:hypothetical protein
MGPHSHGHISFTYTETVHSCCNKGGICGEREKGSLPSYEDAVYWKLAIIRNLIHNYTNG